MSRTTAIRRLGSVAWLVVVWLTLWGDLSWANVISGTLVAAAVTLFFTPVVERQPLAVRPFAVAHFVAHVLWEMVRANFVVAREVLRPSDRDEAVIAVDLDSSDPLVISMVTHAIGLSPGTAVIDVEEDPTVVYVHVMNMGDIDEARADVRRLEELALRALQRRPGAVS